MSPRQLLTGGRHPVTRLYPLTVFFAADGVLFASWIVRIPEIKNQVGASATALGLALLCMTVSSAASMYFAGGLCERLGTRTVLVASFPLVCAGLVTPALARSVVALGAILFVFGAIYGVLLVALNSAAVEIESTSGRAIMSPMHGLWSVGGLVGAVIGGLLAAHLTAVEHFAVVAVAGVLVAVGFARPMLLTGADRPVRSEGTAAAAAKEHEPVRRAARTPISLAVVLLGVVALCTAYGEGAIGDWVALHLREDLGAAAGVAAYGFGVYSVAIATGRLTGGRLIERLGETWVLSGGAVLAAAGVLVTAWAGTLAVAFAGLLAVGLGLANMFPVAIARAGAIGGPRGVGLASTIGNTGMLAGPPLIGFLADQVGLRTALSTVAVTALVAAVIGLVQRSLRVRGDGSAEPLAAEPAEPANQG
ncbi:MFS transporter [Actinopolymorpha singaporensis]|uniref:Fucose permease n=1 Tax=Actinopolymorpha singaporensis TaxID=117157 RepID=A0A1H1U930_9ACTN|nr:MFS transporter [Actinopolymorpha singaporensis]SDS68994.1 Fucose permease [Actinopolymorpha singaporensis]